MPVEEIEEPTEGEGVALDEYEELEDIEPTEADLAEATVPPEPAAGDVESIQDLLVKQEAREEEDEAEDDEAALASMPKEERLEAIDSRVVPMQPTEFMCKNCFLVKHRSQLKDKAKMLCRDCA